MEAIQWTFTGNTGHGVILSVFMHTPGMVALPQHV